MMGMNDSTCEPRGYVVVDTIRGRGACAVFHRRAHPANTERSTADNTTGSSFGLGITAPYNRLTTLRDVS
jgi:hypothetical protein